jgi:two-component system, chemotaxis family, protein-glutamate methylesterase/glutaminase
MVKNNFFIAALGASAGGHDALRDFFRSLPSSPNIAFVVVTHLLRDHPSQLHTILSRYTDMPVHRIGGFEIVRPNNIYVLPENKIVTIRNGTLYLKKRNEEQVINLAIDEFLNSLAIDQREKAIAIIFSGMGSDGSRGAVKIHANDGIVLVQSPGTTPFNGMPWATITSDDPEEILSTTELGANLMQIVQAKLVRA